MAADSLIAEKTLWGLLKTITPAIPVFHFVMPDGQTQPCITFQRVATRYDQTLNSRSQFTTIIFQIDAWAETDMEAGSLSTKIHGILDGLKQGVAEGVALFIMPQNEFSLFEEGERIHRRSMTFEFLMRDYTS